MNPSLGDRIISILAYFTFGMFSLIWIIFTSVTKKRMSRFLTFNLYQAIFISIVLTIISLIYSIAINLLSIIPVIGKLAEAFELFFNQTPIYYTFTISGLLVTLLVLYLSIMSLFGKKSYVPMVSEVVSASFGG